MRDYIPPPPSCLTGDWGGGFYIQPYLGKCTETFNLFAASANSTAVSAGTLFGTNKIVAM